MRSTFYKQHLNVEHDNMCNKVPVVSISSSSTASACCCFLSVRHLFSFFIPRQRETKTLPLSRFKTHWSIYTQRLCNTAPYRMNKQRHSVITHSDSAFCNDDSVCVTSTFSRFKKAPANFALNSHEELFDLAASTVGHYFFIYTSQL